MAEVLIWVTSAIIVIVVVVHLRFRWSPSTSGVEREYTADDLPDGWELRRVTNGVGEGAWACRLTEPLPDGGRYPYWTGLMNEHLCFSSYFFGRGLTVSEAVEQARLVEWDLKELARRTWYDSDTDS